MQPESRSVWPVVGAVFTGLWITGITWFLQAGWWTASELAVTAGATFYPIYAAAVTVGNAVLVAGSAALLLLSPRVRVVGKVWLGAALVLGVIGLARAIPGPYHEWFLAAQIVLLAPFAWRVRGWGALGLATGLAVAVPWAWGGSLGGWVESLLGVVLAFVAGYAAGGVLRRFPGGFWAGGLVAGVALLVVAAGIGQPGVSLTLMLLLAPLGFVASVLRAPGQIAAMTTGLAVGPLLFVDPGELSLSLNFGSRDVGYWAALAVGLSLVVVLMFIILYGVAARHPLPHPAVAAAMVLIVLAGGTFVYFGLGQPGWHGDRLFVVLKSQADVGGLKGAPAVHERLTSHAASTQQGLRKALGERGLKYKPYYLVNAIEVWASDPVTRGWLSSRSDVDRVLGNPELRPVPERPEPLKGDKAAPSSPLWNVEIIGAPAAWASGARGQGVVIGSSDSGVDGTHPAIAAGWRGGSDSWLDPWYGTKTPTDLNGHGTHTVGSAAGKNGVGVAPDAQWIGCVNLGRNMSNPASYLDCMEFMLAPGGNPARAANVLNNSWGCPVQEGCDPQTFAPAVRALRAAGIFFVVSAGNTGPFCQSGRDVPSRYTESFSVGAVNKDRQVTSFSSRGPVAGRIKPDITAPGAAILSALPGGGYGELDGTSMAGPHVAGVVALIWSANPELAGNVERTEQILRETASPVTAVDSESQPIGECGDTRNVTGAGLVSASGAVALARSAR